MLINPCLSCGACCAYFRVSFYWAESDAFSQGSVPMELTEKLGRHLLAMKGTNQQAPRCIALEGEIGCKVSCTIYKQSSSVCKELEPSWMNNEPNPKCDRARMAYGLKPLIRESWIRDSSG